MKSKSTHHRNAHDAKSPRRADPAVRAGRGEERKSKPGKTRIDMLLVERGLAPSREKAQAVLLAGQVRVDGQRVDKAGTRIRTDAKLEVADEMLRYVSRGGLKLDGALEDFGVSPGSKICIDIGSSTGGFTDCLLQHRASRVYAVDVTVDQLDWKLRQDRRVIAIERNARYLGPSDLPEQPEFVTIDLSFISVEKVLPPAVSIAADRADFLILVKPQFELEKREVGKGGVVREAALHQKAIERVTRAARQNALEILEVKPSRITGAEGNQEFFLHARKQA